MLMTLVLLMPKMVRILEVRHRTHSRPSLGACQAFTIKNKKYQQITIPEQRSKD